MALVLTGGDTAHAVLERLGTHEIRLEGECEPGVPFGIVQGGVAHGIAVVLKSGGFGDDSTLWAAVQYLRGSSS